MMRAAVVFGAICLLSAAGCSSADVAAAPGAPPINPTNGRPNVAPPAGDGLNQMAPTPIPHGSTATVGPSGDSGSTVENH